MKPGAPGSFGAQLKALREAAGFTQEELATITGLSVHGVSALERGERRWAHVDRARAVGSHSSSVAFGEIARELAGDVASDVSTLPWSAGARCAYRACGRGSTR